MVKSDCRTVNVKKVFLEQIEKILQYEEVKKEGIINTSQFIDYALKEKLEKLAQKRMSHVNIYDDHVKIMDNHLDKIGRIVSVYFKKGKNSWCDYCESANCIHIQYAWKIPSVRSVLEELGLKQPRSRIRSK